MIFTTYTSYAVVIAGRGFIAQASYFYFKVHIQRALVASQFLNLPVIFTAYTIYAEIIAGRGLFINFVTQQASQGRIQ